MEAYERLKMRAHCMELAVRMCELVSDGYSVTSKAEEYWQWLSKDEAVAKPKLEDDIPF